jgi:aryl carrier-like protein
MQKEVEKVKAQNEIMREALDSISIMVNDQRWNDIEHAIEALKKVKDAE